MDATRERDRRMLGKISRRPSAWLAWLLWVLIVAPGEAVVIPYQIDWFYLTHPHLLDGEVIVEVFGGLIMVLAIAAFATVGPWLPRCARRTGSAGSAWPSASSVVFVSIMSKGL